jgi:capsular exopolysaccharide synthesis family protein
MYNDSYPSYQNDITPGLTNDSQFDLAALFRKFLAKWYYFVIGALLTSSLAFLYLKLTPDTYMASATLLIKTENSSPNLGENQYLQGGIQLLTIDDELENQLGIIQSFNMVQQTMKRLDFNVMYYEQSGIKTKEVYKSPSYPFAVIMEMGHIQLLGTKVNIEVLSDQTYKLSVNQEKFNVYDPISEDASQIMAALEFEETYRFGEKVDNPYFSFTLEKSSRFDLEKAQEKTYFFLCMSDQALARQYQGKLGVSLRKNSSIITLTTEGNVPGKEIDFLNQLCETYIQSQLNKKNEFAENTVSFIQEQLSGVKDSLRRTESKIESAKTTASGGVGTASVELDERSRKRSKLLERDDLRRSLSYYQELLTSLKGGGDRNVIPDPIAMGITSSGLSESVADLKQLISDRTAKSVTVGEKSAELAILDRRIERSRANLVATIESIVNSTRDQLTALNSDIGEIDQTLQGLPSSEIAMINIQREFTKNDNLFQYLMQRLAEAQISRAATRADSRVLDDAQMVGNGPISPNKLIIMITAFLVGFIIPAVVILAIDFFDTKIRSEEQIRKLSPIPVLGNIIHRKEKDRVGLLDPGFMMSPVAEAFRYLKINLDYLLATEDDRKVVTITSTIKGEGKTFNSTHLGAVMAQSGKKTLLIGADVRRPAMHHRFSLDNEIGLCDYLIGSASLEDIIQTSPNLPNLHVISSGKTPPNPVEVLNSSRLGKFFEEVRKLYDYIVVDTPPVGLVSDFLILSKYSDINLYVTRQNYSQINFIKDANKLQLEQKVSSLYFIVNDVQTTEGVTGYARHGQKYGYEYASSNGKSGGTNKRKKSSKTPVA